MGVTLVPDIAGIAARVLADAKLIVTAFSQPAPASRGRDG